MNNYKIVEFDKINSEVIVDFVYNGFQLRDRVSVKDFSDAKIIQSSIEQNYARFAKSTGTFPKEKPISQEVQDLIDVNVEVTELAVIDNP